MNLKEFLELYLEQLDVLEEAITAKAIQNKFPVGLKNYTEIHSRGELQGILKDFGRGWFKGNSPAFASGFASHPGGADKRFYWGIDDNGILYIVAKNNIYENFIGKMSKTIASIIGQMKSSINVPSNIAIQSGVIQGNFGKQELDSIGKKIYNKMLIINKQRAYKFESDYKNKKINDKTLKKLKVWAKAA